MMMDERRFVEAECAPRRVGPRYMRLRRRGTVIIVTRSRDTASKPGRKRWNFVGLEYHRGKLAEGIVLEGRNWHFSLFRGNRKR